MSEILIVTQQGRRCGYCTRFGHNQSNCPRANADGLIIHQQINNSIHRALERNYDVKEWLSMILYNYTVRQLSILMKAIFLEGTQATPFMQTLEVYRIVPIGTSLLRLKYDRVLILTWFYLNIPLPFQNNNYIFDLLNNNLYLKLKIEAKEVIWDEKKNNFLEEEKDVVENVFHCPICIENHPFNEKLITNCNHEICKNCMVNFLEHHLINHSSKKPVCSLCRTEISSITFVNKDYKEELTKKYFA
jgi:hypothetical protein